MNIKAKYKKGQWYLSFKGKKVKTSLVKGISKYIDSLNKPQEMHFNLTISIDFESGQGVMNFITCYATSDFTLPFIQELENQIDKEILKLKSSSKLKFEEPDTNKDVYIDNDLVNRNYRIDFQEKSKNLTLPILTKTFAKTKILRKARRIYFSSESYNITVETNGVKNPMYKGVFYFDKEQNTSYIEDFKTVLKLHEKVLEIISESAEE